MGYSTQEVDDLIRKADKAGDEAAVRRLLEYRGQVAALPARPAQSPLGGQAAPKPPSAGRAMADSAAAAGGAMFRTVASFPDMLADAGDAVTRGFTSLASGGLRAVGADDAAQFVERGSPGNKQQFRIGQIPDKIGTPRPVAPGAELGFNLLGGLAIPMPAAPRAAPRLPSPRAATAATVMSPRNARVAAAQAATRQGITMMPADVGGTGTRMASGVIRRTLGEIPMAAAAQRGVESARTAVRRVATSLGSRTDVAGAGQAAQRGARAFIANSEARASQLYDAIPIAGQRDAALGNTKAILGDLTAGLESNPELSRLIADPKLAAYGKAIAGTTEKVPTGLLDDAGNAMLREVQKGGKLSWQDLKAFRTYVGERLGAPSLQSDTSQGALKALYAGLSRDMEATATATGPRALSAFRRANQYYRGRSDRIDSVLSDILGRSGDKGDEAAFQQINRWADAESGNARNLARAMRSMPADEAGTIRATVVSRLGKASPGRQTPDGLEFSPLEFSTQWNKMSDRAKSTLFPDARHRADLNDIAVATHAMKRAAEYANTSNTGLVTNAAAHAAGLATHPIFTVAMAGGEYSLGVLLSSPRVARTLARAPAQATAGTVRRTIAQLNAIAKNEPGVVANEIGILQRHLESMFLNKNVPMRAAAEPGLTGTVTDTGDYSAGETPEDQQRQQRGF